MSFINEDFFFPFTSLNRSFVTGAQEPLKTLGKVLTIWAIIHRVGIFIDHFNTLFNNNGYYRPDATLFPASSKAAGDVVYARGDSFGDEKYGYDLYVCAAMA